MTNLEKKLNKVVLISVDLETLGVNTANAPILSIGAFAVCFSELTLPALKRQGFQTSRPPSVNYHQILPNYIPHHALDDAKVQGLKLFRSPSILLMLLQALHKNIYNDSKK